MINVLDNHLTPEQALRAVKALSSALKWYALNPEKNHEDVEHVCTLSEILNDTINSTGLE